MKTQFSVHLPHIELIPWHAGNGSRNVALDENPILLRLKEVIEAHLDDSDLSSGNLHRLIPTSRATLHRFLHKYTGMSTSHYLSRYRIYRSICFLSDYGYSIANVAAQVGMNSSAYTRVFRAEFGQTPSDMRHTWWGQQIHFNFETIGNSLKQ